MSGYDRHGSSRDPPVDRGGYYRRDDPRVGAWDGAPRDHHDDGYLGHNHREHHRRDHDRGGYGGPSRRDSYPPRDGYGAGGPDRGDPGYGRYAPYDRAPNDRYRDPPERERYGGYDRRDAYDRPPISDPAPAVVALHWNKAHFREAGLDPERPPRTLEELDDFSRRLTRTDAATGELRRVGFLPQEPGWFGWAFPLWFGGQLLTDGKISLGSDPAVERSFAWVAGVTRELGQRAFAAFCLGLWPVGFG